MQVMKDGTVKISLNDVKAFDRTKKREGDLYDVAKRLNKNAKSAKRRREIAAFNALDTFEKQELFGSSL